jgi:uncharacterized protein YyaL (SSP411 family)
VIGEAALRYPSAFARWLSVADFASGNVKQVAILGDPGDEDFQALVATTQKGYRPYVVMAASTYPPASGAPDLLADRPLLDGKPAAYVCQMFVCKQPVSTAAALREQLM